jgi:hypothetical protein
MRLFFVFVYFILGQNVLQAQERPTISAEFYKRIVNDKAGIKYIKYTNNVTFLDSMPFKKDQFQQIIKTEKTSFLTTSGSGLVYQLKNVTDSTAAFSRIDSTQYDGYNFDDVKFTYNDTLFSIGGFGFWRNNGQVRYFSENKEWELLFPEIPIGISNRNIWNLDDQRGILYFITENEKGRPIVLTIHLSKHSYEIQEAFSASFTEQIIRSKEIPVQIQLTNNSGSLLVYSDKIYYLNIGLNQLKIESDKSLINFLNKNNVRANPVFNIADKLIIASINENKLDSITFSTQDFSNSIPVIENKKFFTQNKTILLISLFILLIVVIVYFKFSKKKIILFTEFEKDFLNKLTSKKGKQLDIEALNYLLGLSKKSIEIQKKNRSEFLNKLDQKLRDLLHTEEVLIIRVRDEADKRIFLYQLNELFFDQINKLL